MRVAITGISGFIGGQIALNMQDAGHEILGIDRRPLPEHLEDVPNLFYQNDYAAAGTFDKLTTFDPQVIVHCAGTSLVGPSMTDPTEYYHNNVVKTLRLLDFIVQTLPRTRIIFSSSASVYGNANDMPCKETSALNPVSPYGESKMMIEKMLESFHRAYDLDYVAFRFFNACGADSTARHGQEKGGTHIIAKILESIHYNKTFVCNGDDYNTRDGTCVRDYIHVADLAQAHVMAMDLKIPAGAYNLGTEQGHTNLEVIELAKVVIGRNIDLTFGPRRLGDPSFLTADARLFQSKSAWRPQYQLHDMIRHAWLWSSV